MTRATLVALLALVVASQAVADAGELEKLTTAVPFPRGLAMADPDGDGQESLYVLSRGRSRGDGGADTRLDDQAGTLWEVDPTTGTATVFARPTMPPFRLLDRTLASANDDVTTDRPYCVLRWDESTRSFFICAFSGIDLPAGDPQAAESGYFRKNESDAVLRYDVDEGNWSVVDRHERGTDYPHDSAGWVRGPNNLVVAAGQLIVAAKDNDRLVGYDLAANLDKDRPGAGARVLLETDVVLSNRGNERRTVRGHSAVAVSDGWLYVGFRTSGEIIRLPILGDGTLDEQKAELLAMLEPFDPSSGRSANVTDIAFGPDGMLHVLSATPSRIFRFDVDPANVRDFARRDGRGLISRRRRATRG